MTYQTKNDFFEIPFYLQAEYDRIFIRRQASTKLASLHLIQRYICDNSLLSEWTHTEITDITFMC